MFLLQHSILFSSHITLYHNCLYICIVLDDNTGIKMDFKETEYEDIRRVHLTQDEVK
jgi:hypothetical protein